MLAALHSKKFSRCCHPQNHANTEASPVSSQWSPKLSPHPTPILHSQDKTLRVVGISASSGVSDQPRTEDETRTGARNRAKKYQKSQHGESESADESDVYYVGLEGGIVDCSWAPALFDCFAWMAVLCVSPGKDEQWAFARTASFTLPKKVSSHWLASSIHQCVSSSNLPLNPFHSPLPQHRQVCELLHQGVELGKADDIVFERYNSKQGDGTVGILTRSLIDRTHYYVHALTLALIPFMNPTLY